MSDTLHLTASVELAQADDGPAKFSIAAYNGDTVRANGWRGDVIVDVASLRIPERDVAVLRGHDHDRIVGHGTATKTDSTVTLAGVVSADNEHSREFVSAGRSGFPWQASVGLSGIVPERIPSGRTVTVNGRSVSGPAVVLRNARLDEISVLPIGADRSTSISIAASAAKDKPMSKGFEAALSDIEQDENRVAELTGIADKYRTQNPARVEALLAAAVDDDTTDPKDFEIGLLRAVRPSGINNRPAGNGSANLSGAVMSAALCQSAGLDTNKLFDDQTNQSAHESFRGRFGVQQLLLHAANANGGNFTSFQSNPEGVVKAAFVTANLSGFSTVSAANVLADVANKSLEQFFLGLDNAWRKIARVVSVRNYQPHHRPSMIADLELVPLAKDGEVQHGLLVDQDRTISVTDYARMLQLSEVDIANDDLGALTDASRGYAYGADEALNKAFYAAFLANAAAFWTAGRGNLLEAGSALSSAALQDAHVAIGETSVTIGDVTKRLYLDGKYLLVPRALGGTARELMTSEKVVGSTDRVDANIWRGRFEVVEAPRLDDDSSTAWYLVADPNRIATIEVAFLNGQQVPRVESAACSVESGRYGIASRAKLAFGVSRAHYQGIIKSTGAP